MSLVGRMWISLFYLFLALLFFPGRRVFVFLLLYVDEFKFYVGNCPIESLEWFKVG